MVVEVAMMDPLYSFVEYSALRWAICVQLTETDLFVDFDEKTNPNFYRTNGTLRVCKQKAICPVSLHYQTVSYTVQLNTVAFVFNIKFY